MFRKKIHSVMYAFQMLSTELFSFQDTIEQSANIFAITNRIIYFSNKNSCFKCGNYVENKFIVESLVLSNLNFFL